MSHFYERILKKDFDFNKETNKLTTLFWAKVFICGIPEAMKAFVRT